MKNIETSFYNDLLTFSNDEIQSLINYFKLNSTKENQRLVLAKHIAKNYKKGTLQKYSINDLHMVFLAENESDNEIDSLLSKINKNFIYSDRIPNNSKTGKGEFKAFLIMNDNIIGYAKGKYITKLLDLVPISSLNHFREAIVNWIQIFPSFSGKGYCVDFMKFILTQIRNIKDYNKVVNESVEVINTGGIPGCKCYIKAAQELQGIGVADSNAGWRKITVSDCEKYQDKLSFLAFKESPFYHV